MANAAVLDIINVSKIPDTIKMLPTFDGDSNFLHIWLSQVQDVIDMYRTIHNNPIWNIWLQAIRTKVVGKAGEALTMRNVRNDWAAIRTTLIEHFNDQRDLSTLCQSIPYLKQNTSSVDEFYTEVSHLSTKINQKINLDVTYNGHTDAVTHFASQLVKNAFIDGLNRPYGAYTRNARPDSLIAAFQVAREQYLADNRIQEKQTLNQKASFDAQKKKNFGNPRTQGNFQRASTAQNQNNFQRASNSQGQNYQEQFSGQRPRTSQGFVRNNPQQFVGRNNFRTNQAQYQDQNQASIQKPTPMEVDTSGRSRQTQPMSVSRMDRNIISHTEQEDFSEEIPEENSYENEFEEENYDLGEANFHLETQSDEIS